MGYESDADEQENTQRRVHALRDIANLREVKL